ncbi:lipocalin-like domain-containing protein [Hymenobacter terricola]|uniref:lipocalin-like domain-containing protein n=1 Tax=Hymenobacter terricola TaxID=2819236 RepID=UPI001B303A52|nr:lipocalin-like domain-containing protein [Hymenobacter terricola]
MASSLKEQLIGAWTLVSLESEDSTGTVTQPMGENPTGLLLYTPTNYMSVHIMQKGLTELVAPALYEARMLKYADLGYLAYCGHYHADEAAQLVTHQVEISLYLEWLGQPQVRAVRFEGELLHLTTVGPHPITRLVWRRNQG